FGSIEIVFDQIAFGLGLRVLEIAIGTGLITIIVIAAFVRIDNGSPFPVKADGFSAIGVCDQLNVLSGNGCENREKKKTNKQGPHLVAAQNDIDYPLATISLTALPAWVRSYSSSFKMHTSAASVRTSAPFFTPST